MRMLHISDFHFRDNKNNNYDQQTMIDALINSVKDRSIDLVLFTGDLVFSGKTDFEAAYESVLGKLSNELSIPQDNIMYIPGNHEVNRDMQMPAIISHIQDIRNNQDLDDFVLRDKQFSHTCFGIDNYDNFVSKKSSISSKSKLYWTKRIQLQGKSIGVVGINSAWLSYSSDTDSGKLAFPIVELKNAITEIKESSIKILLMHHPLSDLIEYNRRDLENIIVYEFHAMFSGHVHMARQSAYISSGDGLFHSIAPASLSFEKEASQGYMLFDWDLDSHEIVSEKFLYQKNEKEFYSSKSVSIQIPVSDEKRELNELRKTIRRIFSSELNIANDLFVSRAENSNAVNFMELFTEPTLSAQSPEQLASQAKKTQSLHTYESILTSEENYLFYGADKFGKTSLLMKLQLDYLNSYSEFRCLPYYVDMKALERTNNVATDILSACAAKYGMTRKKLLSLTQSSSLLLLIDNYEQRHSALLGMIEKVCKEVSNLRIIVCAKLDIYYYKPVNLAFNGFDFKKIYIHSITKRQIRTLAHKWPNLTIEKVDIVIDKIDAIFSQLNIHFNYWTVSLFLWIFEKTNDLNFHNNVELIDLYVDNLLGKSSLTIRQEAFSFQNYKRFLADLAFHLYSEHAATTYTVSYVQLISFIDGYIRKNPRIIVEPKEIFDYLEKRGVISSKDADNYTFRLNGIFEYFLAYYMRENKTFLDSILNSDELFLSFSNELEILSGMTRSDTHLLETLYARAENIYAQIRKNFKLPTDKSHFKKMLSQTLSGESVPQISPTELAPLAPEEQDDFLEEFNSNVHSEVTAKKTFKKGDVNTDIFARHIFVLSRAFRNSDGITEKDKITKYLSFVIEAGCDLVYCSVEEFEILSEKKYEAMKKFVSAYSSIITQVFLYDAVGHINLKNLLLEKISDLSGANGNPNEIESTIQSNQFHLFVTYFLLIETDVESFFDKIEELIEITTNATIRNSILAKLYFYLVFKSHKKPELEARFRKLIQELHLIIDPKVDLGPIHKKLDHIHKINVIKAGNDKLPISRKELDKL